MKTRILCAGAALAAAILLSACSDPEKDANALFVQAADIISKSASQAPIERLKGLQDAKAKLDQMSSGDLAKTAAAVKVASGDKVGGLTKEELDAAITALEGSPEVCGALKTEGCAKSLFETVSKQIETDPSKTGDAMDIALHLELAGMHDLSERISTAVLKVSGIGPQTDDTSKLQAVFGPLAISQTRLMPAVAASGGTGALWGMVDWTTALLPKQFRQQFAVSQKFGMIGLFLSAKDVTTALAVFNALPNEVKANAAGEIVSGLGYVDEERFASLKPLLETIKALGNDRANTEIRKIETKFASLDEYLKIKATAVGEDAGHDLDNSYLNGSWQRLSLDDKLRLFSQMDESLRKTYGDWLIPVALKAKQEGDDASAAKIIEVAGTQVPPDSESGHKLAMARILLGGPTTAQSVKEAIDSYVLPVMGSEDAAVRCKDLFGYLSILKQGKLVMDAMPDCSRAFETAKGAYVLVLTAAEDAGVAAMEAGPDVYNQWLSFVQKQPYWSGDLKVFIGRNLLYSGMVDQSRTLLADPKLEPRQRKEMVENLFIYLADKNSPDALDAYDELSKAVGHPFNGFRTDTPFFDVLIQKRPEQVAEALFANPDYGSHRLIDKASPDQVIAVSASIKDSVARAGAMEAGFDRMKGEVSKRAEDAAWNLGPDALAAAKQLSAFFAAKHRGSEKKPSGS
ncbi:exported hypothetical protein [Mesorhizobium plurifarium]|uniref:Uncharacterized protein n=1 Tax=Mesorhizobium plurifarium TaxID=69974 RepID=A0A0K2VMP4_MESPL|nr:exported hypothetical protein [Mesorhizobium plurifarium]